MLSPAPPGSSKYVLSAINTRGRRVTQEVAAATPLEAVRELESRGFTEVTLVTDDLLKAFAPDDGPTAMDFSAKDRASLMNGSRLVQGLVMLKHIYVMLWKLLLIPAAIVIYRRIDSRPWSWIDAVMLLLLVLPALVLWLYSGPVGTFRKIELASVDSRWDEVLRLCHTLEQQVQRSPSGSGLLAVAQWRSKALMKLGREDEALVELDKLRTSGKVPETSILMVTGLAYQTALKSEEAVKHYRRITELDERDNLGWLLLAEAHANALQQPELARDALSHVDRSVLAADSLRSVESAEAGIALCEGRAAEAAKGFENMIKYCRAHVSATPSAQVGVFWFQALHAIACVNCGRTNDAIASFKAAAPGLERAGSARMLARLNKAMGKFALPA